MSVFLQDRGGNPICPSQGLVECYHQTQSRRQLNERCDLESETLEFAGFWACLLSFWVVSGHEKQVFVVVVFIGGLRKVM